MLMLSLTLLLLLLTFRQILVLCKGWLEGGVNPPQWGIGIGNFAGGIFSPAGENLRGSDFDDSNFFQSNNSIL